MRPAARRRLVLVGGGHAHLAVLADLARRPVAGVETVLVSPFARHHYSGMVPGYLQGRYDERDLAFDLESISARAGARFVRAFARRVDPASGTVATDDAQLAFDVVSLDVGCAPAGIEAPGARERALTVRPMSRAVALREELDELAASSRGGALRACVVGGGLAGVEVALAVDRRARSLGTRPDVTIVESGARVVPDWGERPARRIRSILAARGVRELAGRRAERVERDGVVLDTGESVRAELVVWLTGAYPPDVVRASPLPKGDGGFFLVDAALRSADGAPVWGAGDCVALDGYPWVAKAGVYAVREAPVLAHNLRAALEGGPTRRFTPQRRFLALVDTADGKALLHRPPFALRAGWALRLKERIDRGYVRRTGGGGAA